MPKVSIFTTATNPHVRGDNFDDSIACYSALADEVVIINGGEELGNLPDNVRVVKSCWPQEFSWEFIGQQFQMGYEACTGDWVIHCDLDFLFHESDFEPIRNAFDKYREAPAVSFWKYQFILPDRYNLKSRLVLAVNKKKYGDRIKFNSGGDLCQPSLDGEYIKPNDIPEARVPFYNYEKMTKDLDQIMDDCGRMERAYKRHFGNFQMGSDGTDESAFNSWMGMVKGRFNKPQEHIRLDKHPIYVQKTIKNLAETQFGHSGFGLLEINDYARQQC